MVTPYAVSRDRPVLSYTWPSHGSLSPSTVEGGPSGPKASIWEQGPGGAGVRWNRGSLGSLRKAKVLRGESSEGGEKSISGEAQNTVL